MWGKIPMTMDDVITSSLGEKGGGKTFVALNIELLELFIYLYNHTTSTSPPTPTPIQTSPPCPPNTNTSSISYRPNSSPLSPPNFTKVKPVESASSEGQESEYSLVLTTSPYTYSLADCIECLGNLVIQAHPSFHPWEHSDL
jgi:hypothetical protein